MIWLKKARKKLEIRLSWLVTAILVTEIFIWIVQLKGLKTVSSLNNYNKSLNHTFSTTLKKSKAVLVPSMELDNKNLTTFTTQNRKS